MTDSCLRAIVEAVHSCPTQAVIYLSGGASQALGWLMSVPGSSNTVLESVVTYSRMSMIQLLGKVPSQAASSQTAEEMALLAYNRALKLSKPGSPVLGVGFTGALASARPKRGDHRHSFLLYQSVCPDISFQILIPLGGTCIQELSFLLYVPRFTRRRINWYSLNDSREISILYPEATPDYHSLL